MINSDIVAAVDLGSLRCKGVVLEWQKKEPSKILAASSIASRGVVQGKINDAQLAFQTIETVLKELAKQCGRKILSYLILVNDVDCRGQNMVSSFPLGSRKRIQMKHITEALGISEKSQQLENLLVLHNIIRCYTVNDQKSYEPPLGVRASALELESHLINVPKSNLETFFKTLENQRVRLHELVFGAVNTAETLLNSKQKEEGALLLDFGYGKTSLSFFYKNTPYLTAIHRLAGVYVVHDLRQALKISQEQAIELLEQHGACSLEFLGKDSIKGLSSQGVTAEDFCAIIAERLTEIFSWVLHVLKEERIIAAQISSVAFCGGLAQISGFEALFRHYFRRAHCFFSNENIINLQGLKLDASFVPALGLALYAFAQQDRKHEKLSWGKIRELFSSKVV